MHLMFLITRNRQSVNRKRENKPVHLKVQLYHTKNLCQGIVFVLYVCLGAWSFSSKNQIGEAKRQRLSNLILTAVSQFHRAMHVYCVHNIISKFIKES